MTPIQTALRQLMADNNWTAGEMHRSMAFLQAASTDAPVTAKPQFEASAKQFSQWRHLARKKAEEPKPEPVEKTAKGKYVGKNPLEKLHDGEMYFFLRAQDKHAPDAVKAYSDQLFRDGDYEGASECMVIAIRMLSWQGKNRDLVKKPD